MLGYLSLAGEYHMSLDTMCSSKLEARFSEQIMSADMDPSLFSRHMEPIVYIIAC